MCHKPRQLNSGHLSVGQWSQHNGISIMGFTTLFYYRDNQHILLGYTSPEAPSWWGGGWCLIFHWYVVSVDTGHIAQSPQFGPQWSPAFKMEPVLSVSSFNPISLSIFLSLSFCLCVSPSLYPTLITLSYQDLQYIWDGGKQLGSRSWPCLNMDIFIFSVTLNNIIFN